MGSRYAGDLIRDEAKHVSFEAWVSPGPGGLPVFLSGIPRVLLLSGTWGCVWDARTALCVWDARLPNQGSKGHMGAI